MNRRRLIWLIVFLAAGACVAYWLTRHETPPPQPPLVTIDAGALAALRAEFNAAQSHPRLIVLLSPT
jgi:hypothetical protein